jgi:epoxide hydrolase
VKTDIRPFRIDVPQADLDVLLERLSRTCLPDEFPGVDLAYGLSLGYVKHLLEDWRTGYE